MPVDLSAFVASILSSPLAPWAGELPWRLTAAAEEILSRLLEALPARDFVRDGGVAIHRTARIEAGATIKAPAIIGADCFLAAGAYLRNGVWLAEGCVLGPGVEVKSSFLFAGARLAHFNFVGDAVLGAQVNLEAGCLIANHRNERGGEVRVRLDGRLVGTGVDKFGALLGDGVRIGANAVLAPGTLLARGAIVGRLALIDQEADPASPG